MFKPQTKYWIVNRDDAIECAFYVLDINDFTPYVLDPEHYYTWVE